MDPITLLPILSRLPYPDIEPIFFQIGPFAFRWYGLMYLIGLGGAYWLIKTRSAQKHVSLPPQQLSDLIVYAAFGVFLGGRLGYVLFYNLPFYLENPAKILAVWEGGMSFHGGLIGVCIALWWFCTKRGLPHGPIADLAAGAAPLGLGFGRMGNFINGELYGRATDVEWCMVFPQGGPECRHPSQLYEAGLEGVVLFVLLTVMNRWSTPPGTMFWTFISGYGISRFFVEFFREPDSHLGFIFQWVTMGQLLCIPMIALGVLMIIRGYKTRAPAP